MLAGFARHDGVGFDHWPLRERGGLSACGGGAGALKPADPSNIGHRIGFKPARDDKKP